MFLPEGMRHVLHRVEAEAVHADAFRQGKVRVHQVLADFRQFGPEVGQAGHARGHVVVAAGAALTRAKRPE